MNDDEIAQLNLFSGLAMHALITNRDRDMDSKLQELAIQAVQIAEDLMTEIASAQDRADD
jgi:hypothetical protein